jgi:hypothetical protein
VIQWFVALWQVAFEPQCLLVLPFIQATRTSKDGDWKQHKESWIRTAFNGMRAQPPRLQQSLLRLSCQGPSGAAVRRSAACLPARELLLLSRKHANTNVIAFGIRAHAMQCIMLSYDCCQHLWSTSCAGFEEAFYHFSFNSTLHTLQLFRFQRES